MDYANPLPFQGDSVAGIRAFSRCGNFQKRCGREAEPLFQIPADVASIGLEVEFIEIQNAAVACFPHGLKVTGEGDSLVQIRDLIVPSFNGMSVQVTSRAVPAILVLKSAIFFDAGKKGVKGQPGRGHVQLAALENQLSAGKIDRQ